MTEPKKRDLLDYLDVFAKLLIPAVGAVIAWAVSVSMEQEKIIKARYDLYTNLISQREQAESNLRKDMFKTLIDSALTNPAPPRSIDDQLLNLELLAANFGEALNLKPLFANAQKQIQVDDIKKPLNGLQGKQLSRLWRVSSEITRNQMTCLRSEKNSAVFNFNWTDCASERKICQEFSRFPSGTDKYVELVVRSQTKERRYMGGVLTSTADAVDEKKRYCRLDVLQVDPDARELRVRLYVVSHEKEGTDLETSEFWLSFFDFPMIDNIRLSQDLRCAVVMNDLDTVSKRAKL